VSWAAAGRAKSVADAIAPATPSLAMMLVARVFFITYFAV
jgi:hypothetical protein